MAGDVDPAGRRRDRRGPAVLDEVGGEPAAGQPDPARVVGCKRDRGLVIEHQPRAVGQRELGAGALVGAELGAGRDGLALAERSPGRAAADHHAAVLAGRGALDAGELSDRTLRGGHGGGVIRGALDDQHGDPGGDRQAGGHGGRRPARTALGRERARVALRMPAALGRRTRRRGPRSLASPAIERSGRFRKKQVAISGGARNRRGVIRGGSDRRGNGSDRRGGGSGRRGGGSDHRGSGRARARGPDAAGRGGLGRGMGLRGAGDRGGSARDRRVGAPEIGRGHVGGSRAVAVEQREHARGEVGGRDVIDPGAADPRGELGGVVARIAARVAAGEVLGVARDRIAVSVDELGQLGGHLVAGRVHRLVLLAISRSHITVRSCASARLIRLRAAASSICSAPAMSRWPRSAT